ncbi:hypothetical protein [Streptomyces sp. NPDC056948]|uniref:effector-associated constant component EACC1 n=1 Tax=Streptomyces sp. NPDC056948 TaxID=3345975 RepID=UPI003626EA9F
MDRAAPVGSRVAQADRQVWSATWGHMCVYVSRARAQTRGPDAGAGTDLTALFADCIAQDRRVGPHAEIQRVRRAAEDGAMSGDLVDWLDLVLSSGFPTAALVYARQAFRASLPPHQRPATRLVVEHRGPRFLIEDGTPEDAARLARALATATGDSAPEGGTATDAESDGGS